MAFLVLFAALLALFLHRLTKKHRSYSTYNLPPGDFGIPVVGQTFSLIRSLRSNTDDQWFRARVKKYGPVSKMSVLGSPTVLLAGPAANHFIFTNESLALTQTRALHALLRRSIFTLSSDELKQVRSAVQGCGEDGPRDQEANQALLGLSQHCHRKDRSKLTYFSYL